MTVHGFELDLHLVSLVSSETRHPTLEIYEARGIKSKIGTFIDFTIYLEKTHWIVHMDYERAYERSELNEGLTDGLKEMRRDQAEKSCGSIFERGTSTMAYSIGRAEPKSEAVRL